MAVNNTTENNDGSGDSPDSYPYTLGNNYPGAENTTATGQYTGQMCA